MFRVQGFRFRERGAPLRPSTPGNLHPIFVFIILFLFIFGTGDAFKARRLVYHSTLGWRVIKKKKKEQGFGVRVSGPSPLCPLEPALGFHILGVQGYLAYKKTRPPRTLQ